MVQAIVCFQEIDSIKFKSCLDILFILTYIVINKIIIDSYQYDTLCYVGLLTILSSIFPVPRGTLIRTIVF